MSRELHIRSLLAVRPIARGARQRVPTRGLQIAVGDRVEIAYVDAYYTDVRRGTVVRKYVRGSVEVRYDEPVQRIRAVSPTHPGHEPQPEGDTP